MYAREPNKCKKVFKIKFFDKRRAIFIYSALKTGFPLVIDRPAVNQNQREARTYAGGDAVPTPTKKISVQHIRK